MILPPLICVSILTHAHSQLTASIHRCMTRQSSQCIGCSTSTKWRCSSQSRRLITKPSIPKVHKKPFTAQRDFVLIRCTNTALLLNHATALGECKTPQLTSQQLLHLTDTQLHGQFGFGKGLRNPCPYSVCPLQARDKVLPTQ